MSVAAATAHKVHVIQGECRVGSEEGLVLATVLGSCVSACLWDPVVGVGGMNHFLLPGDECQRSGRDAERYGAHLMELLINGVMSRGGQRERLLAKLFGGARVVRGLSDVGRKNAEFARRFMKHEGIKTVSEDLGGDRGRRVEFWPVSGRARMSYIRDGHLAEVSARDAAPVKIAYGDVELF